ncbi:hypothetical protein BDQ17DRAFT_1062905 [Cyathus striatus]|nr:hypothetical protein BDQ17DRAFT_1062905 [Cyathus striatus]
MIWYLYEPIQALDELAKFKVNGGYCCHRCDEFSARKPHKCTTRSHFERHWAYMHSPWAELELQMYRPESPDSQKFHCPGEGCKFRGRTLRKVQNHMLSKKCPDKDRFLLLKLSHSQAVACYDYPRPKKASQKENVVERDAELISPEEELPLQEVLEVEGVEEEGFPPQEDEVDEEDEELIEHGKKVIREHMERFLEANGKNTTQYTDEDWLLFFEHLESL